MRIQSLSALAVLATLSRAQSPQLNDYRSLCPAGQDTGTKTFDNGITAEYTCRVKASSAIEPSEETARSSEECAAKCGSGCSSAVWQYTRNRCLLYDSLVTLSPHARGSLYLKPTGNVEGEEGEVSDCQHEREACEDELEQQKEMTEICEQEKSELQAERDTCQSDEATCAAENDTLMEEHQKCKLDKSSCDSLKTTCEIGKMVCESGLRSCEGDKGVCEDSLKACNTALVAAKKQIPATLSSICTNLHPRSVLNEKSTANLDE